MQTVHPTALDKITGRYLIHFGSKQSLEDAMTKVNKEQKQMLLEFLEANNDLATGKFSSPQGAKNAARLWEEVAMQLNACGVRKSWKEWRKCWHDLKTATKGKAAALALEGRRTGGGPPAEKELNEFHKRVYALIGANAVMGHQDTCESRVMVLGEEIGDAILIPIHNRPTASTSTMSATTPITPSSSSTIPAIISVDPNLLIPCPSETDTDSIAPATTPCSPTPTTLQTITLPTPGSLSSRGAKGSLWRKRRLENSRRQEKSQMAAEQLVEVEREKMVIEERRMLAVERGLALEEKKMEMERRKMELEEERVRLERRKVEGIERLGGRVIELMGEILHKLNK